MKDFFSSLPEREAEVVITLIKFFTDNGYPKYRRMGVINMFMEKLTEVDSPLLKHDMDMLERCMMNGYFIWGVHVNRLWKQGTVRVTTPYKVRLKEVLGYVYYEPLSVWAESEDEVAVAHYVKYPWFVQVMWEGKDSFRASGVVSSNDLMVLDAPVYNKVRELEKMDEESIGDWI